MNIRLFFFMYVFLTLVSRLLIFDNDIETTSSRSNLRRRGLVGKTVALAAEGRRF